MPVLEGLKDGKEFLVLSVIVEFCRVKEVGMESDRVNFAVGRVNGEDGGESIVQGIHLDHDLGVRHPMGEKWCMCELLHELVKGCVAFSALHYPTCPIGLRLDCSDSTRTPSRVQSDSVCSIGIYFEVYFQSGV
jgi:hypothetical protein